MVSNQNFMTKKTTHLKHRRSIKNHTCSKPMYILHVSPAFFYFSVTFLQFTPFFQSPFNTIPHCRLPDPVNSYRVLMGELGSATVPSKARRRHALCLAHPSPRHWLRRRYARASFALLYTAPSSPCLGLHSTFVVVLSLHQELRRAPGANPAPASLINA